MKPRRLAGASGAFALLLLAAFPCAGTLAAENASDPDPLEPMNRAIYRFNEFADRWVGKPVARAYRRALPQALRNGAGNFLDNLRYPITIVNDLLQGKVRQGGADLGRFVLNSTVGLAGLFDPAAAIGLRRHDEDFGQTLAVWGIPAGPYLVVPIFGPYTLSHGLGELLDTQFSLISQYPDSGTSTKLAGWHLLHKRYRLLDASEEVERAFDPYLFVRDAYLQNRRYEIHDGNVPEDDLYLDEDEEFIDP